LGLKHKVSTERLAVGLLLIEPVWD